MAMSLRKTEVKNEEVCRTCLSKEGRLQCMFEEGAGAGAMSLDYVVGAVTGVRILRGDGLPATICAQCRDSAEGAFHFQRRAQEADSTLRGLYKKEKMEYSTVEVPAYQHTGVKTERLNMDDHDDFMDSDFNLNGPEESSDIEPVKTESKHNTLKTCKIDSTDKKKTCIKVEIEDSFSTYCPLCGTSDSGADNLTKHMWTYHAELMGPKKRGRPKKLVTSSILTKLSENGFYLKSVPVKSFDCVFCKLQCRSKEDLSSHMAKHKDTKVFCCILCKQMFLKKRGFDQHSCMTKGNKSEKNRDDNCLTEIMLHDLLDPSCDLENMNVLQACRTCSGVFLSQEDLTSHNELEHLERSLRCNNCTKSFTSAKAASRHRSLCRQVDRKHICNTCGLKFAYEISLNKHILRHHEGQSVSVSFMDAARPPRTEDEAPAQPRAQYQCDTCHKCFPKKETLAKHAKTHMPLEKTFECDICKKKFSRKDNLRSHRKIHDPNREKPPNNCLCLYCGRAFSNSSNLIVHMRRHTGEKPYKCDFCGKGFPRSSDLQCHRRSHTGEKPCVCRVCGKAFSRSNKLSRHMRVHTGLKPYKCSYCAKAFSQSNDLTLHVRRHTGDKPYICEVCGDRFIQGTALQNHRRVHGHFPPPAPPRPPPDLPYCLPAPPLPQPH